MRFIICLVISLALHVLPFIGFRSLLKHTEVKGQLTDKRDVVPKPLEVTTTADLDSSSGEQGNKKTRTVKANCKKSYVGIGVRFSERTIVGEVYRGYSAERFGVLVGDEITNALIIQAGEENSFFDLWLVRAGQEIKVTLPREKICYE